jgi:hypothetical protein
MLLFATPGEAVPDPPVIRPEQVIFVFPAPAFITPQLGVPPAVAEPLNMLVTVIFNVPVPLLLTPDAWFAPIPFPLISLAAM